MTDRAGRWCDALTSGPSADLIGVFSLSKPGGAGLYSPYVEAIMDVARIMENLHTAEYPIHSGAGDRQG